MNLKANQLNQPIVFLIFSSILILPFIIVSAEVICPQSQVLIEQKCTDRNFAVSGYVYEDNNDNGILDQDDYNYPAQNVTIFSNKNAYCEPNDCGYTIGQTTVQTDTNGKYQIPASFGQNISAVLLDDNYILLNKAPDNIVILPANKSNIRSDKDNTFNTPFLVKDKNKPELTWSEKLAKYFRSLMDNLAEFFGI